MTNTLDQLKPQFETLIRAGRFGQVRKQLKLLPQSTIPRQERVIFANLARRSGAPRMALSLLRPYVRSENTLVSAPSPQEISSYAMALAALGALSEARALSELISGSDAPEALLACAYIHIWRWDYAKAVPYLKRYIQCKGPTAYQIQVAKLNLAAAYDYLNWTAKKQAIVDDLIKVSSQENWHLIHRDALILEAQEAIARQDWQIAKSTLDRAYEISQAQNLDSMIIKKWQTFMGLKIHDMNAESMAALAELRSAATSASRWEIIRDCDYFLAKAQRDTEGVNRVYFGTPFPSFRNRIRRETSEYWSAPESFLWMPSGVEGRTTLDLSSRIASGSHVTTLPDDLRFRLLRVLASDRYRPFKIGSLFAELYPGESYDTQTSPAQTFDVLQRLRGLLKENQLEVEIQCLRNQYRLKLSSDLNFMVYAEDGHERVSDPRKRALNLILRDLRKAWPHQSFSTRDASHLLNQPDRKTRGLLVEAAQKGLLYQSGSTKSRVYRFQK